MTTDVYPRAFVSSHAHKERTLAEWLHQITQLISTGSCVSVTPRNRYPVVDPATDTTRFHTRVAGHFLVQSLPLWPAPTAALALAGSPMQANAEPTDAPDAEENVPTRMDNQHNKLDRTMPVRSHKGRNAQSPICPVHQEPQ